MKAIKLIESPQQISKAKKLPLPLPASRAIQKLGSDVALARRRRHISQASLAERIGASLNTIKRLGVAGVKIESGDLEHQISASSPR